MTTRSTIARHRAEVTWTNSLAVIAKAVGDNACGMGRQAAVIAAASGLVLTSGIAANAAETNVQRESTSASALEVQSAAPATTSAASTIAISYEKPVVKVQDAAATQAGVGGGPAALAPAGTGGSAGATIAAAAYAQLGVAQDCTALATNALTAAGIHYHGWPAGYLSLGRIVSPTEARPGDLVYYRNGGLGMAHIALDALPCRGVFRGSAFDPALEQLDAARP